MIPALIISLLHSGLDDVSSVKEVHIEKLRKRLTNKSCFMIDVIFDSFSCCFV